MKGKEKIDELDKEVASKNAANSFSQETGLGVFLSVIKGWGRSQMATLNETNCCRMRHGHQAR